MTNCETSLKQVPTEHAAVRVVFRPRVDIVDQGDALVLIADLPGVSEQNSDVSLEKNILTIRGMLRIPDFDGHSLIYAEHGSGEFQRAFTLSKEIDRERIETMVRDGVLRITLPKRTDAGVKRITVRTAGTRGIGEESGETDPTFSCRVRCLYRQDAEFRLFVACAHETGLEGKSSDRYDRVQLRRRAKTYSIDRLVIGIQVCYIQRRTGTHFATACHAEPACPEGLDPWRIDDTEKFRSTTPKKNARVCAPPVALMLG